MKLFASLIAVMTCATGAGGSATNNYATTDSGGDCLTGWTAGSNTCDPPSDLTNDISCTASAISAKIKPSEVYEHHDRIPTNVLSGLKVKIAGATGSYQDFISFGK